MLKFFVRCLLRILYRVEVRGTPALGSTTLIIGNHQGFLDAPILWTILPANTVWVVHSQVMQNWVFRMVLRTVEHIVVDTSNPFALKHTIAVVESGKPVIILPEGRLTNTGALMKVYDGPGFVAAKTGATLAAFIVNGAARAKGFTRMTGDYPLAWFPKITITFFPAAKIQMPDAPTGKLRRRKAGEEMRRLLSRCIVLSRPRRTLHGAFLDAVDLHGRGRHMVEDAGGADQTYGGMVKASLALGRLVSKFTAENEVVGVLMPNAAATLSLLLGMMGTRRIAAMLNFTAGSEGMQSASITAGIKTVLTSRAFLEKGKLTQTVEKLQGVRIVFLEDLRPMLTLADKLWLLLYAVHFPRAATLAGKPDDPAFVLFTSGSEGKPKGVVLSHWSLLSNVEQCLAVVDVSPADKIFSAMPVFHCFGLCIGLLLPVVAGIRLFLYPSPLHYRIVPELCYDRDATIMFATPTFLKNYAKRAHPYDFRKVRVLLAGAEKLSEEVRNVYMEKFGVRILEGYGVTECSPVISINTPMFAKSGTVGEPLPLMECRLEPVPGIDEGGILHVKGPSVMLGYWREPAPRTLEPPASIFGEGWYSTGDLATIDDDGFVRLLGRMKRFAKIAGEMVSLELVERIAETASPSAVHAAVIRPDSGRGEMIVLCTQDANLKRDQLQHSGRSMGTAELAIPRRVLYVEKIPLLGTGKKDYPKLSQMVEELLSKPQA